MTTSPLESLPLPEHGWVGKPTIRAVWFYGETVAETLRGAATYLDRHQSDDLHVATLSLDVYDPDDSDHAYTLTVFLEEG